ncbi:diguanylate cyclase/phosphodiesterase [Colwellia chukchiensis]|uniref:Diguanylate cyclase/phosphodiesterase n=1 Tax=Colwellia chukchiensis TaxID=641665 RepID=A0A1H7N4W2_9GAMM|nr:EAL domain-containing protein [Colwellia chukchiensis]SEL18676.1 diguanylate cyclase/phosphodiesterase [Colwellia chukchiensis]
MKLKFVSVSAKFFVLVVGALLVLSLSLAMLSISRLEQEFAHYQSNKLRQGKAQFAMQSRIQREQAGIWLESFTDLIQLKQQENFQQAAVALKQQFDSLQINHNVEALWLVSSELTPIYQSSSLSRQALSSMARVKETLAPDSYLSCQQRCLQLVSIPVLNARKDMAIVTMAISLVDVIYAINQALENQVAIVAFAKTPQVTLAQAKIVTSSATNLMSALFNQNPNSHKVRNVVADGLQVEHLTRSYLINLLPLASSSSQDFYLTLVDDVSSFTEKYQSYRMQFVLSVVAIFIIIALLVHFVAGPFTKRILVLSDLLPLLAQKEFEQFRAVTISQSKLFPDEVDILINASTELSYELEQLNRAVTQKTKELENIAMYDLLTGLANRNMLNYQLRKQLISATRNNSNVGILFLDLDDFKKVNDSHGHGEGDKLLVEAAKRISHNVANLGTVCRFGGDEFVIVLNENTPDQVAKRLAKAILASFHQPIKVDSAMFYVTCSIGIAMTEGKLIKASELVSHADIAMYEAKDNGGDQYFIYHGDMFQRVAHRVMMEGEVKQALAKGQFSLSLQPQLVAKTNKVYGFEALLRWQHPERGMVSPDDFIPILENSEHMIALGYWVIRRCFQLSKKIKQVGLDDVVIAINLSAAQFTDVNLPDYLNSLLDEFQLTAASFELELTEQTLVKDIDKAIISMDNLRLLGFSFAIDDFGTGYSSLAYLKRMPVDVIKIDKSFVFGMLENNADFQIIMSTIAMVKNLGLTVIAEGVETQAQLRSLTENDCDLIQGYFFSKPIPETELFEFIDSEIVDGKWRVDLIAKPTSH